MLYFILGVCSVLVVWVSLNSLWGFSQQKPSDYESNGPKLDFRTVMQGHFLCEGLVYDFRGKVVARFKADMHGEFEGSTGTLKEHFIYASGREDNREWTLSFNDDGSFTATAPDIVGIAIGQQSGNTVKLTYKIKLPQDAGGHVLSATDWMYLTDHGTLINRSEMRKYGIKVAELFAVMKHRDLGDPAHILTGAGTP